MRESPLPHETSMVAKTTAEKPSPTPPTSAERKETAAAVVPTARVAPPAPASEASSEESLVSVEPKEEERDRGSSPSSMSTPFSGAKPGSSVGTPMRLSEDSGDYESLKETQVLRCSGRQKNAILHHSHYYFFILLETTDSLSFLKQSALDRATESQEVIVEDLAQLVSGTATTSASRLRNSKQQHPMGEEGKAVEEEEEEEQQHTDAGPAPQLPVVEEIPEEEKEEEMERGPDVSLTGAAEAAEVAVAKEQRKQEAQQNVVVVEEAEEKRKQKAPEMTAPFESASGKVFIPAVEVPVRNLFFPFFFLFYPLKTSFNLLTLKRPYTF